MCYMPCGVNVAAYFFYDATLFKRLISNQAWCMEYAQYVFSTIHHIILPRLLITKLAHFLNAMHEMAVCVLFIYVRELIVSHYLTLLHYAFLYLSFTCSILVICIVVYFGSQMKVPYIYFHDLRPISHVWWIYVRG
jgi:hypothetical protein